MQTLVPIGTFENKARGLLGNEGFEAMLELLARRPRAGKLIQGTGGLRKIRIAPPGQGKSGSTRVIYYYHNAQKPILLLLIYAKAKQENLTSGQKSRLKKYVDQIIEEFGWRQNVDDKLFNELEANLKEAAHVAKGKKTPETAYFVITPATIKEIRRKVNMSQAVFARSYHLSLDTLKGWEQGKRSPDAAASNYLRLIQADPEFVRRTLAA